MLRQLPWPLDRLDRKDIPREERPLRSPPELVAVFGKRGRPAIGSVAVHPDGLFVAGGGFDHSVRLWEAANGREVRAWEGLAGPVRALAFSPDGLVLAAGLPDGSVKLWNVSGGKELVDLPVRTKNAAVTDLEFAPDGKTLATANAQGLVRLWTLAPPKDRVLLKGGPGSAGTQSRFFARRPVAGRGGSARRREILGNPRGQGPAQPLRAGCRAVAFAPDSQSVAIGVDSSNSVKVYEKPVTR